MSLPPPVPFTAHILPASGIAQLSVLQDPDLLREVLENLGSDVAECHAALLVNPFWLTALESADPWKHIFQRESPNMGAPGFFIAHAQQQQLFRRTTKELLHLRLMDADPKFRKMREIRRLEEEFQDKQITLLVRHPTHDVVAEAKIAIIPDEGYSGKFFDTDYPLTVHRVLPVSEYGRCEVALQMPGGIDLIVQQAYEILDDALEGPGAEERLRTTNAGETLVTAEAEMTKTSLRWTLWPAAEDNFALKCTGFIHEEPPRNERCLHLILNVTCAYPTSLDLRSMIEDQEYDALHQASPTAVTEASISIYNDNCDLSPPYFYHKIIEFWMVVARHLSDDASELARLRSCFEETYLLVEVGLEPDVSRWSHDARLFVLDPPVTNTAAFALVPLADEAALLALFNSQSTPVQLVPREWRVEGLPSVEEGHVVYISILDLQTNRVVKLGRGQFDDEEGPVKYEAIAKCYWYTFPQELVLTPSFHEGGTEGATVMLSVNISDEENDVQPQFASVLDLWKNLEFCMTGVLAKY